MRKSSLKIYFVSICDTPGRFQCVGVLSNGMIFNKKICSRASWASVDLYMADFKVRKALEKTFGITLEHMQNNHELKRFESLAAVINWSVTLTSSLPKRVNLDKVYQQYKENLERETYGNKTS